MYDYLESWSAVNLLWSDISNDSKQYHDSADDRSSMYIDILINILAHHGMLSKQYDYNLECLYLGKGTLLETSSGPAGTLWQLQYSL